MGLFSELSSSGRPERSFVGGVWSQTMNAIWPLARLELFDQGIRLRAGLRLLGWLIPVWEARYADLTAAQLIATPSGGRGVCVYPIGPAGPIVFWSRRAADIIDHLQLHAVPIDHSVTQLPWAANVNHP